jgi:hypothetical protein
VSEFRIESGLNCGGHAFATDGLLMGPILDEFRDRRAAMASELFEACNAALAQARAFPSSTVCRNSASRRKAASARPRRTRFLREHYGMDGTGWGSPFLLVPEVTNVEAETLHQLTERATGRLLS